VTSWICGVSIREREIKDKLKVFGLGNGADGGVALCDKGIHELLTVL
jgi:hypothetical protein